MAKARTENRREFLMLAHVFDPAAHGVGGWFMSEKMDGMRAFWDGGITRGLYCHEIPFANTAKDGIRVNPPKATGLWSRSGKPIQAPMWFLDELPPYPLDGELSMGRKTFQALISATRKLIPDDEQWAKVHYYAFDLPDYTDVFRDGNISTPIFEKEVKGVLEWLRMQRIYRQHEPKRRRFESVYYLLNKFHPTDATGIVKTLPQEQLPFQRAKAIERIEERLIEVNAGGGEGLIVRHLNSIWEPQRSWNILKVKPFEDDEATVTGYVWGKETTKGSKLLGLMGALVLEYKGKRFELSGFTDAERRMEIRPYILGNVAECGPAFSGKEAETWHNPNFPIGSKVTFRYRELTEDGLPKEARFLRSRPEE